MKHYVAEDMEERSNMLKRKIMTVVLLSLIAGTLMA